MDEETRMALDQWIVTVDKMLHDHTDLILKMSGHIRDHQVSITALEARDLKLTASIDKVINDFTELAPVSKGGQPDDE